MFCVKCGKENSEKANYCYNCAARLYKPGETPPVAPKVEEKPLEVAVSEKSTEPIQAKNTEQEPPIPTAWRWAQPPNSPLRQSFSPFGQPTFDNPYFYYSYKNKDNQEVYVAYASLAQRMAAAIIDTFVMLFPLFILSSFYFFSLDPEQQQAVTANPNNATLPGWVNLLWSSLYLLYCVWFTARKGQTPGKMAVGIRVINLKDGNIPDLNTAFIRNLFGFSWIVGGVLIVANPVIGFIGLLLQIMVALGFASIGADRKRQGWHDKLAGTLVVKKQLYIKGVNA